MSTADVIWITFGVIAGGIVVWFIIYAFHPQFRRPSNLEIRSPPKGEHSPPSHGKPETLQEGKFHCPYCSSDFVRFIDSEEELRNHILTAHGRTQ